MAPAPPQVVGRRIAAAKSKPHWLSGVGEAMRLSILLEPTESQPYPESAYLDSLPAMQKMTGNHRGAGRNGLEVEWSGNSGKGSVQDGDRDEISGVGQPKHLGWFGMVRLYGDFATE